MSRVKMITHDAFEEEKKLIHEQLLLIAKHWLDADIYHPISIGSSMLITAIILLKNEQDRLFGMDAEGETKMVTDDKILQIVTEAITSFNLQREEFYKQQEQEEE